MRTLGLLLLLAGVSACGRPDFAGGTEFVYAFGFGEAAEAARTIRGRLELLDASPFEVEAADDARVRIRVAAGARLDQVRAQATTVGRLELRRIVRLGDGADDPPTDEERGLWPGGLRWYPLAPGTVIQGVEADRVLCALDAHGITEEALENPRAGAQIVPSVVFDVKPPFRDAMAELTGVPAEGRAERESLPPLEVQPVLALILDGRVLLAAALMDTIRDGIEVTGLGAEGGRALAATVGGGRLPRLPTLASERRLD